MKKMMVFAVCGLLATAVKAAAVGWQLAGANSYANDAYQFFVVGQNGATSIATITALLDAGTSTDAYAFGSGKVAANGAATVAATTPGQPTLGTGTYETFFVLFDSATPTSGSSKYVVVSGISTLTKEIGASTATVTFMAGNSSSIVNNASNWSSFGSSSVPEPTSGLLLLLGMAGLALKRKVA